MPTKTSHASDVAQPGAFVPLAMIHDIDSSISALFVTVEAVRHFMDESDDGSLEWQLLRQALPDSFHDLLSRLDRAGLVESVSRYPIAARAANRGRNQNDPSMPKASTKKQKRHYIPYADESWEAIVGMGRQLLMRYLLEKAIAENDERGAVLLQNAMDVVPLKGFVKG